LLWFFSLEGRPVSGAVRKFKCPLKKPQPFCPCSMVLNWTGRGLMQQNSVNPLAWDRKGAKLSNILHYQTVPIPTLVLTGTFLLLLLYLGCTTNHRSIPSFICRLRTIRVLFCVPTSLYSWRNLWSSTWWQEIL